MCALAGTCNVMMLIVANLIGYGVGAHGVETMLRTVTTKLTSPPRHLATISPRRFLLLPTYTRPSLSVVKAPPSSCMPLWFSMAQ